MESQNLVTETEQLLDGEDLSAEQIAHCVDQLTSEEVDAGLKKNFLIALSQKGESRWTSLSGSPWKKPT